MVDVKYKASWKQRKQAEKALEFLKNELKAPYYLSEGLSTVEYLFERGLSEHRIRRADWIINILGARFAFLKNTEIAEVKPEGRKLKVVTNEACREQDARHLTSVLRKVEKKTGMRCVIS